METPLLIALVSAASSLLSAGGVAVWFKLGPERRKLKTETQSKIYDDLNTAYERISEELTQAQMGVKALEAENESCRKQIQELQTSVSLLQVETGRQSRLSALARARSHLAVKTLGTYELHIDFLLDEMRRHKVPITPIMRTQKLRTAYQAQMDKYEAMEVHELEALLKQQTAETS